MASKRARKSSLQVMLESVEGQDPTGWASVDVLLVTAVNEALNFTTQQLNEYGGSLDGGETVVGAPKPVLTASGAWRGSGTAETPIKPFSALMQAAGFIETLRAATIPVAGSTTASAGTANTITIPVGTDWPASTVLGTTGTASLLGEVVELGGNPATTTWCAILDYSVTASNATITLARNATDCGCVGAVFTTATTVKRIKGTKWAIGSPDPHPSVYARQFRDGVMNAFAGCRPNARFTYNSGGFLQYEFAIGGQYIARTDVAVPTAPAFAAPPVGVNGYCTWNSAGLASVELAVKTMSWDLGNQGMYPDDINAITGVQPYMIGGRKINGNLDPLLTSVATRNIVALIQGGTKGQLSYGWGPTTSYSGFVGNKLATTFLLAKYLDAPISEDNVVLRETCPFEPTGFDNGLILYHC